MEAKVEKVSDVEQEERRGTIHDIIRLAGELEDSGVSRVKEFVPVVLPEELLASMQRWVGGGEGDPEIVHRAMDKLMVAALRSLGYGAAMDVYEAAPRWYA